MIKGMKDIKLTPNQKAKEILGDILERACYWREWELDSGYAAMTQREVEEVDRHIHRHIERLNRQGYDVQEPKAINPFVNEIGWVMPCPEAKYRSCDEVAECMRVSKELDQKLWEVMPKKEKVSVEDCSGRLEWNQLNGTLVSQNWDQFTNEERTELNKVLEGGLAWPL